MKICPVCARDYPSDVARCAADGAALISLSTAAGARPEDLVGHTVDGRYRIERVIGKGGMGTVYACRHVVVGKLAAMKVLKAGVERSEGVLQRFIREAQTANLLRSRHIVEMTDFGQLPNGSFYVVMELLEGEDFSRAMRSGKLQRTDLIRVFLQVAEVLEIAHQKGIVHRDLKPDNVFLVNEGGDPLFVKLLDFGIAKVMHESVSGLTETGVVLGTPYYMSPEQARADPVDHRTDVYALGVMMYRGFTGRLPFTADSTVGVITRHLTEAPTLPSLIVDLGADLERIILRCMEKRPEARFGSMMEVAQALHALSGAPASMRDDPTVNHRQVSEPSHDFPSGALSPAPYATPPGHGSYPTDYTYSQGGIGGELATGRGLATTGERRLQKSAGRGAWALVFGAMAMSVVGAGVAFGLYGRSRAVDPAPAAGPGAPASAVASASATASGTSEATTQAAASAPEVAPSAEATPEPEVTATATARSAAKAGRAPARAVAAPPPAPPPPPPAPTQAPTPAPKRPPTDIRSPFD